MDIGCRVAFIGDPFRQKVVRPQVVGLDWAGLGCWLSCCERVRSGT
jgi:hypothetical protein